MAKKIGDIHIERYDDDNVKIKSGFYPSLAHMARDVGEVLNDIQKRSSGDSKKEGFVKRRDFAHNLIKHFANGMHVNIDTINWCDPKKALPKWSGMNILFATKKLLDICDEPSLVLRGTYSHEKKKFMVADAKSGFTGEEYSVDEVACWMFVPCPIDFSEN